MRPVLITDEVDAEVAAGVRFARAHGIEAVAIRGVGDRSLLDLDDDARTRLADEVAALDVPVASLLSPLFKAYPPGRSGPALVDANVPPFAVDAAVHLAARDRLPPLAAALGAPCVRVFAFLRPPGAAGEPLPDDARGLLSALEASSPGLYAVENEHVCFVASVEELGSCVAATGLLGILDPANDWYLSREPVAPRLTGRLVARLADVHVKDVSSSGEVVPLGDGEVDWAAILARLRELGYDGTLTLEPHLERDASGVARSIEALLGLLEE